MTNSKVLKCLKEQMVHLLQIQGQMMGQMMRTGVEVQTLTIQALAQHSQEVETSRTKTHPALHPPSRTTAEPSALQGGATPRVTASSKKLSFSDGSWSTTGEIILPDRETVT